MTQPQAVHGGAGRRCVPFIALTALFLLVMTQPARAQDGQPLLPGVPAHGGLASALGDPWDLYVCAGDVVTVALASTEFTPYLAVFTDTLEAPIVEAVAEDGEPAEVVIEADATGVYAVIAAGDRRSARGAYTITAQSGDVLPDAAEPGAAVLAYGATVTGVVQTSAGERLLFHGCAGDAVTVAASSEEFTPFIELFDPAEEETVAESEVVSDTVAMIAGAALSTTGTYELFVAGQRRSDRGPFTLTLSLATTGTLAPPSAAATPSPTLPPVVVPPTPTQRTLLYHPGQPAQPARRPQHEFLAAHRRAAAQLRGRATGAQPGCELDRGGGRARRAARLGLRRRAVRALHGRAGQPAAGRPAADADAASRRRHRSPLRRQRRRCHRSS